MSTEEWWEAPTEIEGAVPGPPAELAPREATDVEKYKMPKILTAKWIGSQLRPEDWKRVGKNQSRINPHTIEYMCQLARKGLPNAMIMARSGFNSRIWRSWEQKAAMGEEPYALWYKCVMYSRSFAEEKHWQNIETASVADWKASKWLLEQSNKEEYVSSPKTQNIHVEGDVVAEQSINYVSEEKALEIAKVLKAIGALPEAEVVEGEIVEAENPDG